MLLVRYGISHTHAPTNWATDDACTQTCAHTHIRPHNHNTPCRSSCFKWSYKSWN